MHRLQLESAQSELGSVIPHTDITTVTDITRAAITAITGVIPITEVIIPAVGRTTTAAIDITSITSAITTATKRTN